MTLFLVSDESLGVLFRVGIGLRAVLQTTVARVYLLRLSKNRIKPEITRWLGQTLFVVNQITVYPTTGQIEIVGGCFRRLKQIRCIWKCRNFHLWGADVELVHFIRQGWTHHEAQFRRVMLWY